jgi:two-component system KDP operon response regulator KdpE
MSDTKILVVDDDSTLSELISYSLETEGYVVVVAADGQDGVRKFHESRPDLVILDVSMPKLDGFEVMQRVREMSDTPVIMLTAQGQENDVVRGLDLGADDYMTKPFRLGELLARIRSNLRRAQMPAATMTTTQPANYDDGYLAVDLGTRRITVDGEPVKLTPTEYRLLSYLVQHKGRVLEFQQLLEHVWGFEYIDDIDYLRVYIWHLRRKIEPNPKKPIYLLNELSVGYRFEPQEV